MGVIYIKGVAVKELSCLENECMGKISHVGVKAKVSRGPAWQIDTGGLCPELFTRSDVAVGELLEPDVYNIE